MQIDMSYLDSGSDIGALSRFDWKKIGKGFLIALAGTSLAYISQEIVPFLQSLELSPVMILVVSGFSALVNGLLKLFTDTR